MEIVRYLVKQNTYHGVTYFVKCFAQLFQKIKLLKVINPIIVFFFFFVQVFSQSVVVAEVS